MNHNNIFYLIKLEINLSMENFNTFDTNVPLKQLTEEDESLSIEEITPQIAKLNSPVRMDHRLDENDQDRDENKPTEANFAKPTDRSHNERVKIEMSKYEFEVNHSRNSSVRLSENKIQLRS